MRLFALWTSLAALLMPTMALAQKALAFPKAIQGIWMNDDQQGQVQCRRYLAAIKQDGVDASDFLVGAEVIRSDRWHSYAEYGEGNSLEIQRLENLGGQRWRFVAKAHADGAAGPDDSQPVVSRVKLDQMKLTWVLETIGGQAVDSWDEHRYFRCAAVPLGLYGG